MSRLQGAHDQQEGKPEILLLPVAVFVFVAFLLVFVQLKVDSPLLILERFFFGGGWAEIPLIAGYGALLVYKMQDPSQSARWRLLSWNFFSVVFFLQLALGLWVSDTFLMTGKLHLPIPMMIMGGPVYRGEFSVMTILFLSTIILTGPAWCSHLCYFGSFDNRLAVQRKWPVKGRLRNLAAIKFTVIAVIIAMILVLRWFKVDLLSATLIGGAFGVGGILIMVFLSARQGRMVHCLTWCPIGTIVNYARFINPFRMQIEKETCTLCNLCTKACRFDALHPDDIRAGKPGITCTLCGDCLSSCHAGSIQYRFLRMKPEAARRLYLFFTVSAHAVFLAMARI